MSKINVLAQQIDFLINMQQDALDECLQEFGSLLIFLESRGARMTEDSDEMQGYQTIKRVLNENYERMRVEYEDDLIFLREQQAIVEQVLALPEGEKKEEIIKLVLEEVGEMADTDEFKKDLSHQQQASRAAFLETVNEIKDVLENGSLFELATIFEADQLANAEDFYDEDEDDDSSEDEESDVECELDLDAECEDDCDDDECCEATDDAGLKARKAFDLATHKEIAQMLKEMASQDFLPKEDKKDSE